MSLTPGDASGLYAQLAPLVFSAQELDAEGAPPFIVADRLATCFDRLGSDLGLPARLTEVGIAAGDVSVLAAEAMQQTRLLPNNPREVLLRDAEALYSRAL